MRALDRYEVREVLGRGAAGGVFLVRDRFRAGPALALKRIAARADELLRASFEREFSVLASLSLPGVARVVDFGLAEPQGDDPGGPFFTRTWIDGVPLDEAAAGLDVPARVRLLAQVCAVVAPLHRIGVAHGDLKPANVIVDRAGRPHVIDFGLARLPTDRSASGGVGTPAYMAPELLRGEPPSIVADVYALGATLFRIVTGAVPGAELGDRALAARLAGTLPELPADADPTTRAVLEVALRAMAADPAERLPAVSELVAALGAVVPVGEAVPGDGFVAPRPRGHEAVLAQLETRVTERLADRASEQAALLLISPRGGGKSTLLRELKWRLQLRGVPVIEVFGARGGSVEPIASLLAQAALFAPVPESAEAALRALTGRAGAGLDDAALARAVADAIGAVAAAAGLAILVDDLDAAEGVVGASLRLALHAEGARRVALVAAATDKDESAAVRELGARQVVDVPSLELPDVKALVEEALGAVDGAVVRAIAKHTGGLPAALVDALAHLSTRPAPTAEDVAAIPAGEAGEAAARARLRAAPGEARALLETLAAAGLPVAPALLEAATACTAESLRGAEEAGLLAREGEGLVLAQRSVAALLLDDLTAEEARARVAALLRAPGAAALPADVRARLAVEAGDGALLRELAPAAAEHLHKVGASRAAIALLEALLPGQDAGPARKTRLELARLDHAVGRNAEAEQHARAVSSDQDAGDDERAEAAIAGARAATSAGRYDAAVELLAHVPERASARSVALARRELAKVYLRRGDYDAAERAAKDGLDRAAPSDPVRIELLTSAGMVASYRAERDLARSRYTEALNLATAAGSKRDEANVRTYLAIDHHRAGEHARARDLYQQSMDIARELGDVGSMATFALNLGAIAYKLGEPARAAEHYELAARMARRAGKAATDVMARINLAQLHCYLGLYERARIAGDLALHDAQDAGLKAPAALAVALLGDVAARMGDVDAALARYDDAMARYRKLGQSREVAESFLDSAEALLDRNGPADTSAAVSRVADARTLIEQEGLEEFRRRLRWLLARARGETGDVDGAVVELDAVLADARSAQDRELEWRVLSTLGRLNALRGADFVARRQDQEAMEVLESVATRLPREHRDAFWHDPRRREVRRRAGAGEPTGRGPLTAPSEATFHAVGLEARAARLLELIKRLAQELDVDRLLERITDSAVELAGAERGFVLLVGEDGGLAPRTVRDAGTREADPHVAFSQSIAEAVLIDGEPIITVDARDDSRLSEYVSVHKLMLKSVACLPIRGRGGVVGVLYLEHRMRRGRFDEADVDLLFAFADQAAIALENARLISENERRRRELEVANQELQRAKAEIERVLVARTVELEEAKREVDRARHELRGTYERHGIVGASESMRRVFAVIDRIRDASVSVVIQGESGTGKELVARAIHYAGPRAEQPFVALNCAAIPEPLLESELFGHVRGAFTGAERDRRGVLSQANGGTLFLDEVGDMPAKMQVDLLRVLQDRKVRPVGGDRDELVDVRVIAASNKSLAALVERGEFREDLYYRLNVVELRLPPLRERPGDIPLLCDHFLGAFARRDGGAPKRLSRDALRKLAEHPLPGNVRQLEHVLLNAWVLVEGETIEADDLALEEGTGAVERLAAKERGRVALAAYQGPDGRALEGRALEGRALEGRALDAKAPPQSLDDFKADEKQRILEALERAGWNRVKAAQALDIPRRTFYRRLKEYDIL